VTCLPHPLILAILSFEIFFFADHCLTQTFGKIIPYKSCFFFEIQDNVYYFSHILRGDGLNLPINAHRPSAGHGPPYSERQPLHQHSRIPPWPFPFYQMIAVLQYSFTPDTLYLRHPRQLQNLSDK
jgi:hypothetical protein